MADKDGQELSPPDVNPGDNTESENASQSDSQSDGTSSMLMDIMKRSLGLADKTNYPEQILETLDLNGVAKYIKDNKCKNIITMAGAGISTSAGIPDFRSPGTGLYDNLQKYNLPSPQAMFELDFFKENPKPFFELAKELWPGIFKPTCCHYFIKLLEDKGLLLRHYSQNIDTLERVAGIDGDLIVEAHGTFHTSHCVECQAEYSQQWIKEKIFADKVPICTEKDCGNLVKPDIVFFGERMPMRFFQCVEDDLKKCDLLIILGTSLVVQPFASLTNRVPQECPRLYINMEQAVGSSDPMMALLGMGHGFRFNEEDNYRDVFWQGTCDDGCKELAKLIGWEKDLHTLVTEQHKKIEEEIKRERTKLTGSPSSTKSSPAAKASAGPSSNKAAAAEEITSKMQNMNLKTCPSKKKTGGKSSSSKLTRKGGKL